MHARTGTRPPIPTMGGHGLHREGPDPKVGCTSPPGARSGSPVPSRHTPPPPEGLSRQRHDGGPHQRGGFLDKSIEGKPQRREGAIGER